MDWGELDFLLVDTPPGTSDEHMSLVQLMCAATKVRGAILVTTPQEISLLGPFPPFPSLLRSKKEKVWLYRRAEGGQLLRARGDPRAGRRGEHGGLRLRPLQPVHSALPQDHG